MAAYIARTDKPTAERCVGELAAKIFDIARKGLTGSTRSFLPPHVKAFPYKGRCFYFTIDDDVLTVLRVLGSAQDETDIAFDDTDDA